MIIDWPIGSPQTTSERFTLNGVPQTGGSAVATYSRENGLVTEYLQGDGATWAPTLYAFPLTLVSGAFSRSFTVPPSSITDVAEEMIHSFGLSIRVMHTVGIPTGVIISIDPMGLSATVPNRRTAAAAVTRQTAAASLPVTPIAACSVARLAASGAVRVTAGGAVVQIATLRARKICIDPPTTGTGLDDQGFDEGGNQ